LFITVLLQSAVFSSIFDIMYTTDLYLQSASSVIATSSTIVFRSTATCTSTSSVPCTVTVVPDVHTVISVIFCRVTNFCFAASLCRPNWSMPRHSHRMYASNSLYCSGIGGSAIGCNSKLDIPIYWHLWNCTYYINLYL
jgi:hypothetical protein